MAIKQRLQNDPHPITFHLAPQVLWSHIFDQNLSIHTVHDVENTLCIYVQYMTGAVFLALLDCQQ